ncbi:PriCT-2 domain-containing protein [Halomonas sp. EGI 63088]|uniref:PriCT-2 domain-containing protein n=1 Tax=Halomonas flagellata TaxID=2920385 RepID=A0ABS9RU43_9GAMM|nr:PriCT-2 domain-containing protein [Halomonas flagellata]MCH4563366.1 PriCT-2 domain-containing protein [Halomonas flagellata]
MTERDLLTLDELRLALQHIPADDRETWVSIGNACKTEYGDEGFAIWDEWSQGGQNYKAADAKSVWRSLTPGHVRLGTIIKLATDGGWRRERREMSAEDRRRMKAEAEERRRKAAEQVEADQAKLERMQLAVASACQRVLEQHLAPQGRSPYLERKGVAGHGVLFPRRAVLISIDSQRERADVWAGLEVRDWFRDLPKPRPDHLHMFQIRQGDVVVPLRDASGTLWALQTINAKGTKLFPRFGRKAGNWHWIGWQQSPEYIAITEGYATGASVHEAMGWPVVVALDVGNMARVLPALREAFPAAHLVLCGDDDPDTTGNPGRQKAEALAREHGCVAVFPELGEVA